MLLGQQPEFYNTATVVDNYHAYREEGTVQSYAHRAGGPATMPRAGYTYNPVATQAKNNNSAG